MNRRIKKKRKVLEKYYTSKWRVVHITDRFLQELKIETRHSIGTLIPHDESPWIHYLKLARTGRIGKISCNKHRMFTSLFHNHLIILRRKSL
jgi:hypothetical protein